MSKKTFIPITLTLAIISGAFLLYLFYTQDPRSGNTVIALFLISVFVMITSFSSLLLFLFRIMFSDKEMVYRKAKNSLREGFFLAVYAVALLSLGATSLLTWWDSLLLALSLVLFEIYFLSGREKKL
ncbi:MAG: hypothetical protein WCP14_03955 [bacterium]